MSRRRADLQAIRGLAILSVVLFHFFPSVFPNGYVGVDQFFILSGFLMAKILAKETGFSISGTLVFYYRRMKRLLPLYALFICITTLLLLLIEEEFFNLNFPHIIRSLVFISNTEMADNKMDYEKLLAQVEILFAHTWSLSAEVQFYVIAPFMILISAYLSTKMFISIMAITCILSFTGFAVLMDNQLTKSFAFNSMVTRMWQFQLGILCCFIARLKTDMKTIKTFTTRDTASNFISILYSLLAFLTLASSLNIYANPQMLIRVTVCISTTLLIYIGDEHANRLLSSRLLTSLGDISYSLYLLHWPICVYIKQTYEKNIVALSTGIFLSILLAVLSTEVYEKFYLRQRMKFVISLCFSLYIFNFTVLFAMQPVIVENPKDPEEIWNRPVNLTYDKSIALNLQWNREENPLSRKTLSECNQDVKYLYDTKFCKFNNTEYFGNNRIMLLGNSYARNIGRMFIKEKSCKKNAKDIYMFSANGCEVLVDSTPHTKPYLGFCEGFNEVAMKVVNQTRPDYLFILTRHLVSMYPSNTESDSILEEALMRITMLQKLVLKKIFILDALPRTDTKKLKKLSSVSIFKGWLVDNYTNLPSNVDLLDKTANYKIARKRTRQVVEKCLKCELIDVMPIFMKNNIFQHYDEDDKLIHFNNILHFSTYGLFKIKPMFSQICDGLMDIFSLPTEMIESVLKYLDIAVLIQLRKINNRIDSIAKKAKLNRIPVSRFELHHIKNDFIKQMGCYIIVECDRSVLDIISFVKLRRRLYIMKENQAWPNLWPRPEQNDPELREMFIWYISRIQVFGGRKWPGLQLRVPKDLPILDDQFLLNVIYNCYRFWLIGPTVTTSFTLPGEISLWKKLISSGTAFAYINLGEIKLKGIPWEDVDSLLSDLPGVLTEEADIHKVQYKFRPTKNAKNTFNFRIPI